MKTTACRPSHVRRNIAAMSRTEDRLVTPASDWTELSPGCERLTNSGFTTSLLSIVASHTHKHTHTHMDDVSSFLQCSEWWLVRVVMATSHRPSHVRRNITRHWVRLVLRRGTICSIPSWYVTCHSGQLSLLPRQDGKWVPAKEQRQRCTAGKVIGGLISHWPCVIDCYIHVQAEWPKEGRLTPCLHSPNKYGTTEVQRLKVSLKGPLFNLTQGWIMVPPGHKAWKRLLAPRTYIYI